MTESKHDILTYSKLAEGARFFLDESFRAINEALANDYASVLFSERLASIEPTDEDRAISSKIDLPKDAIGLLRHTNDEDPLTPATLKAISKASQEAQTASRSDFHRFRKEHEIASINILGHLNNLGFFFETLTNRHLLFLRQSEAIDSFSYERIAPAKTMERMVYLFKEGLTNRSVQLDRIKHLFSLRNKTVHFTPDNAHALRPTISDVISIWRQMVDVIKLFEAREQFNEELFSVQLQALAKATEERWT